MSLCPSCRVRRSAVGPNGAGKSTLLKIMAGTETVSNGDALLSPGYTVGILEQEPQLDESLNVLENVETGVAETKALMARFNEISEALADPEADYDTLLAEMGKLQEELDRRNAWDLDAQLEQAMDALRCPPGDADVTVLSGGSADGWLCARCCFASPTCCCSTNRPTISTRRACSGSSSTSRSIPDRRGDHPRPVLLGQRRAVDPGDDRGRCFPYEGNFSTYLGDQGVATQGGSAKDARCASASLTNSSGSVGTRRRAKPSRSRV